MDLSEVFGELIENITFRMVFGRNKDNRFDLEGLVREQMNLVGAFNLAGYVPWLSILDPQV